MVRGRKPKAMEVKIKEGAHLANPQRFKKEVPKTMGEVPIMPEHFSGLAVEEWERIEKVMRSAGLWSATYQVTIELYVESYSNYRTSLKAVKDLGHAIKAGTAADGTPLYRRNPVSVELHKYKEETIKLLTELGLTPSARSRVVLPGEDDTDNPWLGVLAS